MAFATLPEAQHRRLRALRTRGMREKYGSFIVEGTRIVTEALESEWDVDFLCARHASQALLSDLPDNSCPTFVLSDSEFDEISLTENSQGVVAVVRMRELEMPKELDGIIIALDRVADPGNLGTIIRTADWFGVRAVVLGAGCAEVFNPKTVRSTMGSIFHVPVFVRTKLDQICVDLKKDDYAVWCADTGGKNVSVEHRKATRAIVVIGSEAHGIAPEIRSIADDVVAVPRFGRAESLNAASACAALLALIRAQ